MSRTAHTLAALALACLAAGLASAAAPPPAPDLGPRLARLADRIAAIDAEATRVDDYNQIRNLQQIDGAKERWALENRKGGTEAVVDSEINEYIKGGAPECPAGGEYSYNALGTPPSCTEPGHTLVRGAGDQVGE